MCDLQKKSGNKSGKGQEKTREESREKNREVGEKNEYAKKKSGKDRTGAKLQHLMRSLVLYWSSQPRRAMWILSEAVNT